MDFHYLASISMPAIHSKTNAKVIKRNETNKLSRDYFLTFCIFLENDARIRLQMTQIHPSLYPSHINVFS